MWKIFGYILLSKVFTSSVPAPLQPQLHFLILLQKCISPLLVSVWTHFVLAMQTCSKQLSHILSRDALAILQFFSFSAFIIPYYTKILNFDFLCIISYFCYLTRVTELKYPYPSSIVPKHHCIFFFKETSFDLSLSTFWSSLDWFLPEQECSCYCKGNSQKDLLLLLHWHALQCSLVCSCPW